MKTLHLSGPARMFRPPVRIKAVSLVEILIVIAVVAILAALILPVVKKAQEKADDAMCLANLRAINQAALTVIAENDGKMFPNGNWYVNPTMVGALGYSDTAARNSVLTCPTVKRTQPARLTNPLHCTYAMNFFLYEKDPSSTYNSNEANRPASGGPGRLQAVPSLSKMWSFTDGFFNSAYDKVVFTVLRPTEVRSTANTLFYHDSSKAGEGKQMTVFLDGHAEALNRSEFLTGGDKTKYMEFWGTPTLRFY